VKTFWASCPPPFSPGEPSQFILCSFIHFTVFSPLLSPSSSRFVLLFHSPSSYLAPYILNIFLSKISRAYSSFSSSSVFPLHMLLYTIYHKTIFTW
jgi:hypothetical protein